MLLGTLLRLIAPAALLMSGDSARVVTLVADD